MKIRELEDSAYPDPRQELNGGTGRDDIATFDPPRGLPAGFGLGLIHVIVFFMYQGPASLMNKNATLYKQL